MNRRLLAVLLAALAALGALAFLLAWATRGGEPLSGGSGAAAPPDREAPAITEPVAPDAIAAWPPTSPEASDPRALLPASSRLRVVVRDPATRLSPVTVRLQREDETRPSRSGEVAAELAWPDLLPGGWQVLLTGTGWAASPDRLQLLRDGEALVEVRPRNRMEGFVVSARSGRPVAHAMLVVEAWKPLEDGSAQWVFLEVGSAEIEAPDGRFALAGANLPLGGPAFRHLRLRATAPGLLEGASEALPLEPTPEWSGILVALPEPVLAGRVLGDDPLDGALPLPGAQVQLVAPSVSLADAVFVGGRAQLPDPGTPQALAEAETDRDGAFAFGPLPQAATVATVRVLAAADGWLPALSAPIEIDQRGAAGALELHLSRGGRLHGLLAVPLEARGGERRAPVALPESVDLRAMDDGLAGVRRFLAVPRRVPPTAEGLDTAYFEFDVAGLPAGRWRVVATLRSPDAPAGSRLGSRTLVAEVEVADNVRTDVELALEPEADGVTVTGTARLPEGVALDVAEAALFAALVEGKLAPPVAVAPLAADGSFTLRDVPPGDWTLVLFGAGPGRRDALVAAGFVRVGAGSPPPLRLDLARPEVRVQAGPLARGRRLRLAGSCGDPVLDALVALGRVSVQPDADGGARLFGLLPARWSLRAEGGAVDFELPPGADVVHVELP